MWPQPGPHRVEGRPDTSARESRSLASAASASDSSILAASARSARSAAASAWSAACRHEGLANDPGF